MPKLVGYKSEKRSIQGELDAIPNADQRAVGRKLMMLKRYDFDYLFPFHGGTPSSMKPLGRMHDKRPLFELKVSGDTNNYRILYTVDPAISAALLLSAISRKDPDWKKVIAIAKQRYMDICNGGAQQEDVTLPYDELTQ